MNYIVIDKSFLQKVKRESLEILSATNRIVVTDILQYEISTSSDLVRSISCYKKLLHVKDSIDFVPNTGFLMKVEIENKMGCASIENCFYPKYMSIPFWQYAEKCIKNPSLTQLNSYEFSKMYKQFFEVENVNKIKQIGTIFSKIFPEVKGYKAGEKNINFSHLKQKAATDYDFIKEHFKNIVFKKNDDDQFELMAKEYINEDWILFKSYQVYLIYYLIYIERYGDSPNLIESSKLPHDSIDLEYAINGIFSHRIATHDKLIIDIFCQFHSSENCFS